MGGGSEGLGGTAWVEVGGGGGPLGGGGRWGQSPCNASQNHVIKHVMGCKVLCNNPCKYSCNPKSKTYVNKEGIV